MPKMGEKEELEFKMHLLIAMVRNSASRHIIDQLTVEYAALIGVQLELDNDDSVAPDEMTQMEQFLKDHYPNRPVQSTAATMYEEYCDWLKEHKLKQMVLNKYRFGRVLSRMHVQRKKVAGTRYWVLV